MSHVLHSTTNSLIQEQVSQRLNKQAHPQMIINDVSHFLHDAILWKYNF